MKPSSGILKRECRAVVDKACVEFGVVLVGGMQIFVNTLTGTSGIRDGK